MDVQLFTTDLLTFARPWLIPSVIILAITYGALQYIKRKRKRIPDEVKAVLPIALAIAYQLITHKPAGMYAVIDYIGIGIAHGAVLTSIYDIAIRRFKKKLHKED